MSTTAQQVFNITMALVDEVLDTGLISATDTATYSAKTPNLLTLLQAELIKQGDIFKTYEIANQPINNLLGYTSEFNIVAFEGTDLTYEGIGSVKSYYFEVDRVGTVYVEDYTNQWNVLDTINTVNTPEGFTSYKGIVTPTNGATKSRLRFSGSYYYRSVNRALFGIPFALASDVPDYRPWVKKTMPSDFKSVDKIIIEHPSQQYVKDAHFKWEGRNNLYIYYYYKGNIRIIYRPAPAIVAALTDILEIDDVTARTVMPYGLAAHLMLEENADTASFFNQRYEELKGIASKPQPAAWEQIENMYGGF